MTATGVSSSNTALTSNTTYRFRVRAADAKGNLSGYSRVPSSAVTAGALSSSGLVAAYGFNEGSGDPWPSSGNGNNGR